MPTEHWFPIPIYYNHIENLDEVQQELLSHVEKVNFHKVKHDNWDKNSAKFSDGYNEGKNLLNDIKPTLFLNELQKNLLEFYRNIHNGNDIYNIDFVITESWFTRTQKNEYHPQHLHSFSDISGVYYIKTNGNDGNIAFHTPSSILVNSKFFSQKAQNVEYKPQVGKLILWPSLIEHHVISNQTDDDRISLSFNISLRDRV